MKPSHSETFGDLTVAKFEGVLMEMHQSIIVSPYCGQNRWMDNHFAYSVRNINGFGKSEIVRPISKFSF